MIKKSLAIVILMCAYSMSFAGMKSEIVEYKDTGKTLQGYIAYDSDKKSAPGVLVVHDWNGLGEHYKKVTDDLAKMGYVGFAVDIYGKGIRPDTNKEASKIATEFKNDREKLRRRIIAGLNKLKTYDFVDKEKIAAIGFCFGGTTVIELARSGADIKGIVSFHGGLDSPDGEAGKNINASVLVLHGADDPFVSKNDIEDFIAEMKKGKVDWQMVYYGNAVHSFTKPSAGKDPSTGAAYNEKAAKRSWKAMEIFLQEIFK